MKKYRILPIKSIIYFLALIIVLIVLLTIIDKTMPQYVKWEKENNFINKDRLNIIEKKDYPLIKTRRKEIFSNSKTKILIIGDSYIQGDGYSNINQVWWKQLELELYSREYYDVELYGVGRGGASTYDEMTWLTTTSLVEDIKPDIIIIGYVKNDPELDDEKGHTILSHSEPIDYFSEANNLKQAFPNIIYKINNMLNQKTNLREYNDETGYPFEQWYSMIINGKWKEIYETKSLEPLGQYLDSINIPSFVVTTPLKTDPKYEEWYEILSSFEKYEIKTYNMFSEFRTNYKKSKDKNNYKINPVNSHPGTWNTKYYATYISDILEKDYPEILGKKYEEKAEYPICCNDWVPYELDLKTLKEETNGATYVIIYPDNDHMLYMPIQENYIKLSLQYPVSLKEICIEGEKLEKAKVYITTINEELGYDDQSMHLIGTQEGKNEKFKILEDKLITSICIHADIPENEELKITINN